MALYVNIPAAASGGGSGASVSSAWSDQQLAFIQTSVAGINARAFFSECTSTTLEVEIAAAITSGVFGVVATADGGVFQVGSGVTAGGFRIGRNKDATATPPAQLVSNLRTRPWAVAVRAKIVTAPSGAGQHEICGVFNSTDTFFGIDATTSTANWTVSVNNGGVVQNTGVAIETTLYHDLILINDGTNLQASVDRVNAGPTVSAATIPATAGHTRAFAYNGAVAANTEFLMAQWAVYVVNPV